MWSKVLWVKSSYCIEPHNSQDPDRKGKVHHQDDQEKQNKQIEAAFPPAVDADHVDVLWDWSQGPRVICGGDVLLTHHLTINISV